MAFNYPLKIETLRYPSQRRRSKYNASPVVAHGYRFDSTAELRRFQELMLLVRAGEISDLKVHPRYVLQEAFTDVTGKHWAAVTYTADFTYESDSEMHVEDVKGVRTEAFSIRERLFRRKFPDVVFSVLLAERH